MATNPPAWAVTGQLETVGQNDAGAYVEGVKVTFRLASGRVGSVFVPRTLYTADYVQQLLAAQAATMAEVDSLSG